MNYDLIIVGGGPAGYTAAIYAARYKLNTALIIKEPGGIAATAHKVCNFPSRPTVSGFDLMNDFLKHVENLGIKPKYDNVETITKNEIEDGFLVKTSNETLTAKKVLLAIGTQRRKLHIKGEDEYLGKGVSYCATCDGAFFKNKEVVVVGGSDAALTAALLLSEYATKVYIVYRKEKFFRAEPSWVDLVEKNEKIELVFNSEIDEIQGDNTKVTDVLLKSGQIIKTDGVFIEIGSLPNLDIIKDLNVKSNNDYIVVDKKQETSVHGLFAAGDVTDNAFKQIITAAGEGATGAYFVYEQVVKNN